MSARGAPHPAGLGRIEEGGSIGACDASDEGARDSIEGIGS